MVNHYTNINKSITSHLNSLNTKITTTYEVGNPGTCSWQVHKCVYVCVLGVGVLNQFIGLNSPFLITEVFAFTQESLDNFNIVDIVTTICK